MEIRSLGYAVIQTTDLERWRQYATEVLGMMEAPMVPGDKDNLFLKMDERPYRLHVRRGDRDCYLRSGWELPDGASFELALRELDGAGVRYERGAEEELQLRQVKGLVHLEDPSGNHLDLYHGASLDYARFVSPQGVSRFETGFNGDMGLGHVVLPASALAATREFYLQLGFADTDYMHFRFSEDPADPGQGLHFMHCSNPRHHSLALYEDPANQVGCVHLMVEVENVDEVGYCLDRVHQHQVPIVSTLGRHTNDRMLSFYMATPSGFAMEYGCEGLQMDWAGYTPTVSTLPSIWGHKFSPPPEA